MEPLMHQTDGVQGLPEVDAATARQLVGAGAVLLDVREAGEWALGHAPEAAHLPLGRIREAPMTVRPGSRVVVVCRSGNRSRSATTALIAMGYDATNLVGGMTAWVAAGGLVVDPSGRAGSV
jgi:rhodanese-related sulfurtransferase